MEHFIMLNQNKDEAVPSDFAAFHVHEALL